MSANTTLKPKIKLYIADDFRLEIDQKVTAVGLYTDHVIVVNMHSGTPAPSKETPIVLNSISALISISGLIGKHTIELNYVDQLAVKDARLEGPKEFDFPDSNTAANLMIKFSQFATGGPGKKLIWVTIDGRRTRLDFEVRVGQQGTAPKAIASTTQKPPSGAKRSRGPRGKS